MAQIAYDCTLLVTSILAFFFLMFLGMIVRVQTENFMMNQTTNLRFSKQKRTNISES